MNALVNFLISGLIATRVEIGALSEHKGELVGADACEIEKTELGVAVPTMRRRNDNVMRVSTKVWLGGEPCRVSSVESRRLPPPSPETGANT